jgi:hypothetical protein
MKMTLAVNYSRLGAAGTLAGKAMLVCMVAVGLSACSSGSSTLSDQTDDTDQPVDNNTLPPDENVQPGDLQPGTDNTPTDNNQTPGNDTVLVNEVLPPEQPVPRGTGLQHSSLVSEFASFNTPGVLDGSVYAIAVDGDTVFVGGSFQQIQDPFSEQIINQPYLFAYSQATGRVLPEFDPVLDNDVFALETTGEGVGIFAGGVFGTINGDSNRRGLVKIDNNGDRVTGFAARLDALATTLIRHENTLYVGGNFANISGTDVENLAAIDTLTGAVLPSVNLDFDGAISVVANGTIVTQGVQGVDDIDISSDGRLMVVAGNFSTINGTSRPRLAVIELEDQARVSNWNTDVFDVQCPNTAFPQYILGIDIAPDDSYFVVGTTGFRILGNPACDTITRYELWDLSNTDVQPTWVNFTGGDTIYEVVSTGHAVYAGGHFQFLDNDFGTGNVGGPGSSQRAGLAALDPLNGLTVRDWQSDRNPRGRGTFALIPTDEGLFIGDDTDFLNGSQHRKLKFLPLSENTIERPAPPAFPTTLLSPQDNALVGSPFLDIVPDSPNEFLATGWQDARGAMFVGGTLFHADDNGALWMSRYTNNAFQPRQPVDLFGQTEADWSLSRLTGMFFDYDSGHVFYTLQGDSRLLKRAFSPDGAFFGNDEYVALVQADIPWSDISGMDVIEDHLYFARTNGTLYRAQMQGEHVLSGTTLALSGPTIDGRNWANNLIAFLGQNAPDNQQAQALFEFESSGSQTIGRTRNFDFWIAPGESAVLRLEWPESIAALNLFVRDANGQTIARDNSTNGSPKLLTIPAGAGGTYTAVVIVQQGGSSYTLQVNPTD